MMNQIFWTFGSLLVHEVHCVMYLLYFHKHTYILNCMTLFQSQTDHVEYKISVAVWSTFMFLLSLLILECNQFNFSTFSCILHTSLYFLFSCRSFWFFSFSVLSSHICNGCRTVTTTQHVCSVIQVYLKVMLCGYCAMVSCTGDVWMTLFPKKSLVGYKAPSIEQF